MNLVKGKAFGTRNYEPLVDDSLTTPPPPRERDAEQEQHGNRRDDIKDIATGRVGLARALLLRLGHVSTGIGARRRH